MALEIDRKDSLADAFVALRDATETALAEAKTKKELFGNTVNWKDLSCVRISHWVDESADSGFRIEIQEAMPESMEFRQWIERSVGDETGLRVEVETQW